MLRLASVCAVTAILVCSAPLARAASIIVNSNLDTIDGGDGVTTLREALTAAAPSDVISVLIGGGTIAVTAPLPPVPANAIIFGQNVVLDGSAAGAGVDGLVVGNGAAIVRMTIIHFGGAGIRAHGCFDLDESRIGVDAADNAAGNLGDGVVVTLPCGLDQGFISDSIIASNGGDGIRIDSGIRIGIYGCLIGTTAGGLNRGNGGAGVRLANGADSINIGGAGPNTIAWNGGPGIVVEDATSDNNPFSRNILHDNGGLGIDLDNDGVTPNDAVCDLDAGPNGLLNYPVLETALLDAAGNTVVTGVMDGPSFATMTLEFFDTPGAGETSAYLGTSEVGLDATCTNAFTVTLPPIAEGTNVTASGSYGYTTSELWPSAVTVIGGPEISTGFAPGTIGSGETTTVSVTITNPRPVALTGVALTDTLPAGLPPVAAGPSTACTSGTLNIAGNTVTLSGGTIAANDSCTFTFDVVPPLAGAFVHAIAAGAVTATGSAPNDTSASATLTVISRPRITKSFQFPTMPVGVGNLMTIAVTNVDSVAATNVTVTDVYPAGLTNGNPANAFWTCPGGATLTAIPEGNTLLMSGATVQPNVTCVLSVRVQADAPGTFTNTLAPEDVTFNAGAPAMTGASASVTAYARPTATMSFSPVAIRKSGTATLTIEVTNQASIAVSGVTVTNAYPDGMVNASPASGSSTCGTLAFPDATHLTVNGGTIAPGGTCTITALVQAVSDASSILTNILQPAEVTTTESGNLTGVVSATLWVNEPLEISESMSVNPAAIHSGELTMIEFSVVNPNANAVTEVAFHHTFSGDVTGGDALFAQTFGCGPATITITPAEVTISGGTIGSFGACFVNFAVTSIVPGTHVETFAAGELTSIETDPSTLARSVTLNVAGPPTASASFTPPVTGVGGISLLQIDLANPSDSTLNGVQFTQTLPPGLTVANDNSGWNCTGTLTATPGTNTIALTGAVLIPQWTCSAFVPVVADATGTYATSTGPVVTSDAGTNPDGASASLLVLDPPAITKAFDPPSIAFGETSVLTVTLTNPNGDPLTGVGFDDFYPHGLVNAGAASTTCAAGTVTTGSGPERLLFTGGTIPPDSTCTVTVAIGATLSGSRTNLIPTVQTTSDGGPAAADASASLDVAPATILPVAMSFSPPSIFIGGTSRLTITVGNANAVALSGLTIRNSLPGSLSIAATPNAASTCGAPLTATAGSANIAMIGGALAPNSQCSVEVDVTAGGPGRWVNEVRGNDIVATTPSTFGEDAFATLDVMAPISVAKSFGNPTIPLDIPFPMTIVIFNPNVAAVTGLAFADAYPAGLLNSATPVISSSCGGTLTADPGTGSLSLAGGNLPSGGGCAVVIEVVANATGTLTNTLAANSVTTDNAPSNDNGASASITIVPPGPPTATLITYSPTGQPGVPVYVDLRILNPNPTPLTNVGASFTYSAPFTNLLAASSTCGGSIVAAEGTNAMSFTGGTIPPNTACLLTMVVQVSTIGSHTFAVPGDAVSSDTGAVTEPLSVDFLILAPPELSMFFSPPSILVGQDAVLTLDLINPNPVAIDMSFQNVYPDGLVNVMSAAPANTCGGSLSVEDGALHLTGSSVPANGQCRITVLVTAAQAGTYENAIAPWDTYSQDAGSATAEAAATLQVGVASEIPTASDTALMAMAFLMALAAWRVLKT